MSRSYLFPDDGDPLRLSYRLVSGLVAGTDALPQYAGTKQRVLSAMLDLDAGKPVRISGTQASIWEFDDQGGIRDGLHKAVALAMDSMPTPMRSAGEKVIELRPRTKQAKLQKEYRWEPANADIERIIADIWPKKRSDRLKSAQGVSKRRPPLSYDAKHAIEESSREFWKIANAIDGLKEPSLKGFAFEARHRADADGDYGFLYRAVAEMADQRLEILGRWRIGKGTWYALVDVIMWDDENVGTSVGSFHEKCTGKQAAVVAARRLLAEHAKDFGEHITVEAEVMTDLEWQVRQRDVN